MKPKQLPAKTMMKRATEAAALAAVILSKPDEYPPECEAHDQNLSFAAIAATFHSIGAEASAYGLWPYPDKRIPDGSIQTLITAAAFILAEINRLETKRKRK